MKQQCKKKALFALFVLCVFPVQAYAGGFLLYEHNSAGMGMAGARVAFGDDPSAVYFNPAGITKLEGIQLQLGATGILPFVHYQAAGRPEKPRTYLSRDPSGTQIERIVNDGEYSVDADTKFFTPIHLYATYQIGETGVTVGYGLNNPFGLGVFWPSDWDGRFVATETELRTFFNNPVVAVDLAKMLGFQDNYKLSVAAGYTLVYGQAHLGKAIDLRSAELMQQDGSIQDPRAEMILDGSAIGHGWNAAVFGEIKDLVAFGFSLRSGVRMDFKGKAKFKFDEAGQIARDRVQNSAVFPDQTIGKVTLDLPMHFNAGIAFSPYERWIVGLALYGAFFSSYDELKIDFGCTDKGKCDGLDPDPIEKKWTTTWQASLGVEHWVTDNIPIRLGYGIVTSPVPDDHYDPSLPDGFRHVMSIGSGYGNAWWKIDAAYMLAFWKGEKDNDVGQGTFENPEGKANGTYTTHTHLFGTTFTAKF